MDSETLKEMAENAASKVSGFDSLRLAAPQFEVFLGNLEHEGCEFDDLDAAWGLFFAKCMEKLEAHDSLSFPKATVNDIMDGLNDNYFHVGVQSVFYGDALANYPVIAWAAMNKNQYQGWRDEIALVRTLIAAKFDPNLADQGGNTALHYMAFWNHMPGTSSRGVRLLLQAGANPNAQNNNGDTPLCYLAGSSRWDIEQARSAYYLLDAGADPRIPANDGATAISLLKQAEAADPSQLRAELIEEIEGAA